MTKKTTHSHRRVFSRPARASDFQKDKLARWIFETVTGPGVQERIKKAAALPIRFPGNDGIRFDPNW